MKIEHYKLITDPGHGWLAVPRNRLNDLGIAGHISAYSYEAGDVVYLEEDCDLPQFLDALVARDVTFKLDLIHMDPCPIRDMNRFQYRLGVDK